MTPGQQLDVTQAIALHDDAYVAWSQRQQPTIKVGIWEDATAGRPGGVVETLWAVDLGDGRAILHNVPLDPRLRVHDLVAVVPLFGVLVVERVLRTGMRDAGVIECPVRWRWLRRKLLEGAASKLDQPTTISERVGDDSWIVINTSRRWLVEQAFEPVRSAALRLRWHAPQAYAPSLPSGFPEVAGADDTHGGSR